MAERARQLGRLRITHRDARDFYLTAADREEERDENLVTAARVFTALARTESGGKAVASALAEVFPWVRHLAAAERADFAAELIAALSDAAELAIDRTAHEVIGGWRATARIKADESLGAGHDRQHRLRGDLATHRHNSRDLKQWEYEVTSSGRPAAGHAAAPPRLRLSIPEAVRAGALPAGWPDAR